MTSFPLKEVIMTVAQSSYVLYFHPFGDDRIRCFKRISQKLCFSSKVKVVMLLFNPFVDENCLFLHCLQVPLLASMSERGYCPSRAKSCEHDCKARILVSNKQQKIQLLKKKVLAFKRGMH